MTGKNPPAHITPPAERPAYLYGWFKPGERKMTSTRVRTEAEALPEGTSVLKFYWADELRKGKGGWVTIPGSSLYKVTAGKLVLDEDDED